MKKKISLYSLFFIASFCILFTNCQKSVSNTTPNEDIKITGASVSDITQIRATIGAKIVSNGGNTITDRGVCFDTVPNPTVASQKTAAAADSIFADSFSVRIGKLKPNKTYYVRAYATNSKGTGYSEQVTFTTHSIKIGDLFEGGIVFYIDATGLSGLIAAREGENYSAAWGCPGVSVGNTTTPIGSGQLNTKNILKACSTAGIAARWADLLEKDSFGDWYLPSKDELTEMYKHRNVVILNNAVRWSSSEVDANTAWALSFDVNGNVVPVIKAKTEVLGVRVIRSFSF